MGDRIEELDARIWQLYLQLKEVVEELEQLPDYSLDDDPEMAAAKEVLRRTEAQLLPQLSLEVREPDGADGEQPASPNPRRSRRRSVASHGQRIHRR